ncbi:MAG: 50S ribosomal protein L25/general stress protein Ctc [Ahrensia sp.]|nr:50S ribosomal protein L25/general stress protein Ctc [Ahrensia sp.]
MSDTLELKAQARDRVGKGAARELRRNDMVPAVIYGDKKAPLAIALPRKETSLAIFGGGFMTSVLSIDVNGEKHSVLPKDYQLHPVKDTVMHVDLLRVSDRTVVTVEIPVNFLNEDSSPGLKAGGTLNVVRYAVEVNCRADAIPESFDVDLAAFNIDDVIHVSAITMPDGVTPTIDDRDFTIATIQVPRAAVETESDDEEQSVETEVINQKDDADEESGSGD